MTISAAEQEKIRRYLGYPINPTFQTNIANACALVSSSYPEAEETLKTCLRELARLEQQIKNTRPFDAETFNAGSSGTRQFLPGQRLESLKKECRLFVKDICDILNLPVYRDIWGGGGWSGGGTIQRV